MISNISHTHQRTLELSQLNRVNFMLNSARSPQVKYRVEDDEGALMPGDILVT
jgi:hypothetical protein